MKTKMNQRYLTIQYSPFYHTKQSIVYQPKRNLTYFSIETPPFLLLDDQFFRYFASSGFRFE